MKGAVFIALNDLIENEYGIETWEILLDDVKPKCGGVYVSTNDYPDSEISDYVLSISNHTDMSPSEVTRIFGRSLFDELNTKFPIFVQNHNELFSFLMSIEDVIHKEVRKLFETTSLPSLKYQLLNEKSLELTYYSPRKLCFLAEGLIQGAADFYNTNIELSHNTCMHAGAKECKLVVTKK